MRIKRSPSATKALFTPRVTSKIYLSRQVPNEDAEDLKDSPVGIIEEEAGESWIAHYPIPAENVEADSKVNGMIYVYQGGLNGNRVTGKIHYGIEYDLILKEGKIDPESQLRRGFPVSVAFS